VLRLLILLFSHCLVENIDHAIVGIIQCVLTAKHFALLFDLVVHLMALGERIGRESQRRSRRMPSCQQFVRLIGHAVDEEFFLAGVELRPVRTHAVISLWSVVL